MTFGTSVTITKTGFLPWQERRIEIFTVLMSFEKSDKKKGLQKVNRNELWKRPLNSNIVLFGAMCQDQNHMWNKLLLKKPMLQKVKEFIVSTI